MIFSNENVCNNDQAIIIAEGDVILTLDNFTVSDGLLHLIASYYIYDINYPSSTPALSMLLFFQEILLCVQDDIHTYKKSAKYSTLVNMLLMEK